MENRTEIMSWDRKKEYIYSVGRCGKVCVYVCIGVFSVYRWDILDYPTCESFLKIEIETVNTGDQIYNNIFNSSSFPGVIQNPSLLCIMYSRQLSIVL